jgi:peptide/nickel transport system ATP-binding protein
MYFCSGVDTHNIALVDYLSDRVLVMCRGEIVESGPTADVIDHPTHSYM